MKIGVLTFHWADDYGAMLQSYGLKKFLEEQGCMVDIIPYAPFKCTGRYWLIPYILRRKASGKNKIDLRQMRYQLQQNSKMLPLFLERRCRMKQFRREWLSEAATLRTANRISLSKYDAVLVGSDQVWNPELTLGLDDAYMGNVKKGDCKLIAYAASFGGSSLPDTYTEEFKQALCNNFDAISLREMSAVPYVQSLVSKNVSCVLDPTLLITKNAWEKIMKKPKEQGYILVYNTAANEEVFEYADRLAKEKNCKVLRISSFLNSMQKKYNFSENNLGAGPAEFLGLFAAAEYVVTNSFHGTVFSVIFEKNFTAFGYEGRTSRIADFLQKLNLEQHLIQDRKQEVPDDIDWTCVKARLSEEIEESIGFLKQYILQDREKCCGCGACEAVCPHQAIRMVCDKEGFLYPEIKTEVCRDCGVCKKVCPAHKENVVVGQNTYYGVQAKDDAIREESSSGAAFVLLAQWVLKQKGVVFGAALQPGGKVVHVAVEDKENLNSITKTKYVQSNLEGCYEAVKKQLQEGRYVLFVGTPCQIEALRRYIRTPNEKLILVDLVCYGAPSPGIWEKYVRYLEKKHGGKLMTFSFRDKRNRDSGHTAAFFIEEKEFAGSLYKDLFCRAYFRNITIRPSCYQCDFCTPNRNSDFTLGDFWGIEKVRPEFDDGMGTSLLICHTQKAKTLWEEVKENTRWFSCEEQDVLQPRLLSPTQYPKERECFMKLYQYLPFSVWINLFRKWL